MKKIGISFGIILALTACSLFGKDPLNIDGERISVIRENKNLQPDYVSGEVKVRLPKSALNNQWTQSGGNASHYVGHLKARGNLDEIWNISFGEGSSKRDVLLTDLLPAGNGLSYLLPSLS